MSIQSKTDIRNWDTLHNQDYHFTKNNQILFLKISCVIWPGLYPVTDVVFSLRSYYLRASMLILFHFSGIKNVSSKIWRPLQNKSVWGISDTKSNFFFTKMALNKLDELTEDTFWIPTDHSIYIMGQSVYIFR